MKTKNLLFNLGFLFVLIFIFNISNAQQQPVGVVANFPFNGNASDISGNANDGFAFNCTSFNDRFGNASGALYFDSSFVKIVGAEPLTIKSSGAISVWIYKNSYNHSTSEILFSNGIPYNASNSIYLSHNYDVGIYFRYGGTGQPGNTYVCYPQSRQWQDSSWHHMVIKWYRKDLFTTMMLYADGELVDIKSTSLLIENADVNWTIGEFISGQHQEWLNAGLDDLLIFNRNIDESEVKKMYYQYKDTAVVLAPVNTDLIAGAVLDIKWYMGNTSNVKIEWSSNDGASWSSITESAANTGTYRWNVPNVNFDSCKIKISTLSTPSYIITSERFKISKDNLQLNLQAYYPLDGNVEDYSTNKRNATIIGDTNYVFNQNGDSAKAYYLDGSNDALSLGNWHNYQFFTSSVWVYKELGQNNYACVIDNNHGAAENWVLQQYNNNNNTYYFHKNGTDIFFDMPDTQWVHLVFMIDTQTVKVYVNNVLKNEVPINGLVNYANIPDLNIGRHATLGRYFKGAVDEIRFYNRPLKESEVAELYHSTKPIDIIYPANHDAILKNEITEISWFAKPEITSLNVAYSLDSLNSWNVIADSIDACVRKMSWQTPDTIVENAFLKIKDNYSNAEVIHHFELNKKLNIKQFTSLIFNGNTNDTSGQGNHATNYGADFVINRFNQPANAIALDNDSLFIHNNTVDNFSTEGTIRLWIKMSNFATGTDQRIISNNIPYTSANSFYLSLHNSVGMHLRYGGSSQTGNFYLQYPAARSWAPDSWHHVAIVWKKRNNSNEVTLYCDKAAVSSNSSTLVIPLNGNNWCVGKNNGEASTANFTGQLDDINIYSRALDLEEINMLFYSGYNLVLMEPKQSVEYHTSEIVPVRWLASDSVSSIKIELSTDNGNSWTTIATNVPATIEKYNWTTPSTVADSCKIKITAENNSNTTDVSSEIFSIVDPSAVNGIVAYYKLNGDAADASGHGHHGVITGTPVAVADRFGNEGQALYFNGSTDYIDCGNWFNYPYYTISFWVKMEFNQNQVYAGIIDNNHHTGTNWTIQYNYSNNPHIVWFFGNSQNNLTYFDPLDNAWTHVVVVMDKGVSKLYVNNNLIWQQSYLGNMYYGLNPILRLANYAGGNRCFKGALDDVCLFNRALNAAEINTLYTAKPAGIKINKPANSNDLGSDSAVLVSWFADNSITKVDINYSLDDGSTWNMADTAIDANENYYWNTPDTLTNNGVLKISSHDNGAIYDVVDFKLKERELVALSAYYPFSGNANDESGNGYHGTVYNVSLSEDRFGNAENSYFFGGYNNYIDAQSAGIPVNPEILTITCWIKASNDGVVMSKRHTEDYDWPTIEIYHGKLSFGIDGPNPATFTSTKVVGDNQWHFITCVKKRSYYFIYIDGQYENMLFTSQRYNNSSDTSLFIGHQAAWNTWYNGSIDDIRIFNRSLSDNEIMELYQKPNPVSITKHIRTTYAADIYPNPANDNCTLRIQSADLADEWIIRDITGRIIAQEKFAGNSATIDLSNFSAGLYVVTMMKIGKVVVHKKLEVLR